MLNEEQKQKLNEASRLIKDVAKELNWLSRGDILTASEVIESFISIDERVAKDLKNEKL